MLIFIRGSDSPFIIYIENRTGKDMMIFIGILIIAAIGVFFIAKKFLGDNNPDDEIEKNYKNRVMSRYKS